MSDPRRLQQIPLEIDAGKYESRREQTPIGFLPKLPWKLVENHSTNR